MNIRKKIAIAGLAMLSLQAKAQTLEDGIRSYRYEKYQTAKTILTPLAANNALANYYLGLTELDMDQTEAARAIFNKFPEDPANMAGLARVAYKTGNAAEGNRLAKAVADKAKKKEWEPLKYAADAVNYSESNNYATAVEWYTKALERNDNPDLRTSLGDAHLHAQGGGGKAMSSYEDAVLKDPKNSLTYTRMGELWYNAKRYDLALEHYKKAQAADPGNPIPYRNLANAYYYTGKYDLAKQNIEKYLELSDKSVEDQLRYVDILYLNKNYQEAEVKVKQLMNSGVTKPRFYGLLAYAELELKDSVNALQNVKQYFAVQDPKRIFPSDYLKYGKILLMNGMEDSADYYFDRAMTLDTAASKIENYRDLGDAFKARKTKTGYAKAGAWYGRLVANEPTAKGTDYYYWGFWNYYAYNFDSSARAFELMETKFPDNASVKASAMYWRALVAAAVDAEAKTGGAKAYFEKWIANVDPASPAKPEQLLKAYQYLAAYASNSNDNAAKKENLDKIRAIDPNNAVLKQLGN